MAGTTGANIQNQAAGTNSVSYCNINTNNGWISSGTFVTSGGVTNSDPLFASEVYPYDTHQKSSGGRWTSGGWVFDEQTSPCIDTGDPTSPYSLEPMPTGNRVNMGFYGNTVQASKSWFGSVTNANIAVTYAAFISTLVGSNANCFVLYDTNNWGSTLDNWKNTNTMGSITAGSAISNNITGLSPNTIYYWRLYATNSTLNIYGYSDVSSFSTISAPVVDNADGATGIGGVWAQLRYNVVTSHTATVRIYYGTTDGGTTRNNWQYYLDLGVLQIGSYTSTVRNLISGTTYYYRCYATNLFGDSWAPSTTNFTALGAIYVDTNVVGGAKSGASWANAYSDLAIALTNAYAGAAVWVAKGTYTNIASFAITSNGVTMYGGFSNGDAWSQRNWTNNVVVLDGKNALRCLNVTADSVVIDGVIFNHGITQPITVTGNSFSLLNSKVINTTQIGHDSQSGSLNLSGTNNMVNNCYFGTNLAARNYGYGGAIYCATGNTIVLNSVFVKNQAHANTLGYEDYGAAIYHNGYNSTLTVSNCVFQQNLILRMYGGAIYINRGILNVMNCYFASNTAARGGGAIAFSSGDTRDSTIRNCAFAMNNGTTNGGGAIYHMRASTSYTLTVENCSFSTNYALNGTSYGGAIYMNTIPLNVRNSIFWNNMGSGATGKEITSSGAVVYAYSSFTGTNSTYISTSGTLAESNNITGDPLFVSTIDLHLKSTTGRWSAEVTNWVYDSVRSLCIDAGDPASPYSNELMENGSRINMGAYGNTSQASKSLSGTVIIIY